MAGTEHLDLAASSAWIAAYPGAFVGVLRVSGVRNPESDAGLDALLDRTAEDLKARYAGQKIEPTS